MRILLTLALGLVCPLAAQAAPVSPNILFQMGDRVRTAAKTIPHPDDWRFIVVDEIQWKRIMQKSGTRVESQTAVSNLKAHMTFIREGYAVAATDYELHRSLAHEAGHIACGCTSEDKANAIEEQILKPDSR